MSLDWKFSDPVNVAVIVRREIVLSGAWIAYVTHDSDDGGWQFYTDQSEPVSESDVMVLSLLNIVELDPGIVELADLPLGWHAWRSSREGCWQREKLSN